MKKHLVLNFIRKDIETLSERDRKETEKIDKLLKEEETTPCSNENSVKESKKR